MRRDASTDFLERVIRMWRVVAEVGEQRCLILRCQGDEYLA